MGPNNPLHAVTHDPVARWAELRGEYPQASYTDAADGWLYGSLRDEDTPLRAVTLERLIDTLLAREKEQQA